MERQEHIEVGNAIGLSEDELHRLLAAGRRRLTLEILAEGGPMELEALSEEVVRREGRDDVTEGAVERIAVDLYHRHLPLMADLGAIEYDRGSRRVEACRIGVGVR